MQNPSETMQSCRCVVLFTYFAPGEVVAKVTRPGALRGPDDAEERAEGKRPAPAIRESRILDYLHMFSFKTMFLLKLQRFT